VPRTSPEKLLTTLRSFALSNGAALFGTCSLDGVKDTFHFEPGEAEGLDYGLSIAVRLSRAVLEGIREAPTLLYKWHYRQANAQLDRLAFLLSGIIQDHGWRAVPVPASQVVDWERQTGHLSHRHVARAAGLGWLGRNNLLVTPAFGSQVRLVTVLTDLPVPNAEPMPFGCGECRACISACPAQAIGNSASEFVFQRCYDQVLAFCKSKNLGVRICGICVKACPGQGQTPATESLG